MNSILVIMSPIKLGETYGFFAVCPSVLNEVWPDNSSDTIWFISTNLKEHIFSARHCCSCRLYVPVHWFSAELLPLVHSFYNDYAKTTHLAPPCWVKLTCMVCARFCLPSVFLRLLIFCRVFALLHWRIFMTVWSKVYMNETMCRTNISGALL